jgi:purine-nucleoside phosphorylase
MNNDIILHPKKNKKEKTIPATGIMLINPSDAKYALAVMQQAGGKRQFLYNSTLCLAADNSYFIAGPCVGAPMAVMVLEKLIALGATEIIVYSWCGAVAQDIKINDIIIPDKTLSGEGTSKYYPVDMVQPAAKTNHILHNIISSHNLDFISGGIWSTDAPYRESRTFLQKIQQENQIIAVDMEFSALCAVACFRKVNLGGVFIVSDELYHQQWQPGFQLQSFDNKNKQLLKIILTDMQL